MLVSRSRSSRTVPRSDTECYPCDPVCRFHSDCADHWAFILMRRAVRTTQPITQDVSCLAARRGHYALCCQPTRLVLSLSVSVFYSTNSRRKLVRCPLWIGASSIMCCRVNESGAIPKPLLLIYAALCALGGMSIFLFMVQMLAPLTAGEFWDWPLCLPFFPCASLAYRTRWSAAGSAQS